MKKEEKRRIELTTWHETGHAVVAIKTVSFQQG